VIYNGLDIEVNPPPILPDRPICRMTTIKVLIVTITNHLSVSDHVRDVISKCSQNPALKDLRCHGVNDEALRQVYKAVVIAKLLYSSLAWWGIRRQQTESVLRRLFDEEFDSGCTRLTTRRQRNLSTTTTTISLAAYLPTDTTYSNSCFLTRQTIKRLQ